MPVTEQDVMSALKSCYDPEIPVNIVDLGTHLRGELRIPARRQAGRHGRYDAHGPGLSRPRAVSAAGEISARAVARNPQLLSEFVWSPPGRRSG